MGSVQKISIALTDELATDVQAAVASGDYATTSEVVRDALRHWKRARETREAMLVDLRAKWFEGLESGGFEPLDPEEVKAAGRRRLSRLHDETDYLLSSPANAKHLLDGIARMDAARSDGSIATPPIA